MNSQGHSHFDSRRFNCILFDAWLFACFCVQRLFSFGNLKRRRIAESSCDVVIYGATASGAIAAVAAAREQYACGPLLEPGTHVGGMLTGGLSATDVGNPDVIGGDPLEFFERVGQYYNMQQYDQKVSWRFEPHVGEEILRTMLRDAKVDVRFNERLREKDGIEKYGERITSVTTEDGRSLEGERYLSTQLMKET